MFSFDQLDTDKISDVAYRYFREILNIPLLFVKLNYNGTVTRNNKIS